MRPDLNEEDLARGVIRLNGIILGITVGVMAGLLIFVATVWLVIRGGEPLGPHLALLGQFLPGYSVSFLGSVVGLAYGLAIGFFSGWFIAVVYNAIAFRKR